MNYIRLLRAKRWAQRPPSSKRVKLVFSIVAICLVVFAVERFVGWPEFLSSEYRRGLLR